LIIKQEGRHARLSEFVKVEGQSYCLGRGLHNDLIISDPYVASDQVRFVREGMHWHLEIIDREARILLNDTPVSKNTDKIVIHSGDRLLIGRTRLVLYEKNHPVGEARSTLNKQWLQDNQRHKLQQILLLSFMLLTPIFEFHLFSYEKWSWLDASIIYFSMIFIAIAWASPWALVSKIIHHRSFFLVHVFIAIVFMGLISLFAFTFGFWEYTTNSYIFEDIFVLAVLFIMIAFLFRYHFKFAANLKNKWYYSIVISSFLIGIYCGFTFPNRDSHQIGDQFSKALKPPFAKIQSSTTLEKYLARVEVTMTTLEFEAERLHKKDKENKNN